MVDTSQAILYEENGKNSIESKFIKTSPQIGDEMEFERHLVSVDSFRPSLTEAVPHVEAPVRPPVCPPDFQLINLNQ